MRWPSFSPSRPLRSSRSGGCSPAGRRRASASFASAAAVRAFVVFGKVLSPQFLIWLVPLVPLVRGRRGRAGRAARVALVLTQLWFPYRYWDLALGFESASWLVLVRDLVLVALFVLVAQYASDAQLALTLDGAWHRRTLTRTASQAVARPSRVALDEHALDAHAAVGRPEAHGHARSACARSRAPPRRRSRSRAGRSCPASVIAAVPPGSTRASFVCTCVCVPITAVTRPSSQRASATFSLVASAWKSTTIDRRLRPRLLDELVDDLERAAPGRGRAGRAG